MQKDTKTSAFDAEITSIVENITGSTNFLLLKKNISHGKTTVFDHLVAVASASYKFAKKLRLKVDYPSLIRGALLHDYFFYDWHNKNKGVRWHGFKHGKTALTNAEADFSLNKIERDIIAKHMFPLTLFHMPKYKESWIVCLADKWVALKETLFKRSLNKAG